MPKSKEFVASSDESSDSEPKSKKKTSKKSKRESSDDEPAPSKKPKKETKKETKKDEDTVWDLGNNRQIMVREFKGKLYVDIREMYFDKDGDMKPGKKGICLNMTQWRKLVEVVSDVDEAAKARC